MQAARRSRRRWALRIRKHGVQYGGTLYILDGEGRVQRRLDPLQTAIEWFQMSNDAFYALYGVNWVPKEPYYSQARRMVHSGDGRHA